MNQEQNNLNQDNLHIKNNNEINSNQILNNQNFNQGIDTKTTKKIRKIYIISVISLVIYCIVLLMSLYSMYQYYVHDSGTVILIFVALLFLTWLPLLISLLLSFSASCFIKKYQKKGIVIPKNLKTICNINKFQIPLIILVFVLGFSLKNAGNNILINQKLNELYDTNYKILKKCSNVNEGGDNYDEVIIELENFEYPIYTIFDWAYDDYKDNYENLKRADRLNYQSYIKSIFDDKAISLLKLEEEYDDYYDEIIKYFTLNILLTSDYLKDEGILKTKIKEIYNKYVNQFPDYLISIDLYFTENTNDVLKQDYYMIMYGYGCHDGYNMKDGSSITIPMSIIFNNLEYHSVDECIDFGINGWHYEQERLNKN